MIGFFRQTWIYRLRKELKAWYALHLRGNPGQHMTIIGVTGTNGKTTTCTLIWQLLQGLGEKTAYIGTTGVRIGDEEMSGVQKMTSYDPLVLQKILAHAYEAGCRYVVLEVSSHGFHQKRFHGIDFSVGVLTNITPEHLDYHKTMAAYAAEKQKLFRRVQQSTTAPRAAILPVDDTRGKQRADRMQFATKIQYGIHYEGGLSMRDIVPGKEETHASLKYLGKEYPVIVPLVGEFNMKNMLAATGAVLTLGYTIHDILPLYTQCGNVSGRQDRVTHDGVDWYIDYAHTPDGLEVMLTYIRSIVDTGKIWCIFGAPGQRDAEKRPEMARIAERFADIVVITDDDAAKENKWNILRDVHAGMSKKMGDDYFLIPSRKKAIEHVARYAVSGDIVLLAGIGHQDVMDTNFGYIPWSEQDTIATAYDQQNMR